MRGEKQNKTTTTTTTTTKHAREGEEKKILQSEIALSGVQTVPA